MKPTTILLIGLLFLLACSDTASTVTGSASTDNANHTNAATSIDKMAMPEWAKNANIYEVNLRQYTEEGTIAAFQQHLPRLKEMGVDILWLMPIHPISMKKRKATPDLMIEDVKDKSTLDRYKGSPYAVADYKAVNPDYGTMDEFKAFVKAVHGIGMKVIIDWVPNHTGWDNPWLEAHPNWYTQDEAGNIIDPIDPETSKSWGWTDVADLNYDNSDMRAAMIDAMQFWVTDTDIDGFRVDVAHSVPTDFWDDACAQLMDSKRCFLLAEAAKPYLLNSGNYHMDYGWPFHHLMNEVAKGEKDVTAIDAYLAKDEQEYTKGFHMHFTSNHDENTWSGTVFERMEESHQTFAVLAATFDGMPLIYGGQEEPLKKRLEFFESDVIPFGNYAYADFYRTLLKLKHDNQALWNGSYGGNLKRIKTGNDAHVFAFSREKNGDKIVAFFNLSDEIQDVKLDGEGYEGTYTNVFANSTYDLEKEAAIKLNAWGYMLLSNK